MSEKPASSIEALDDTPIHLLTSDMALAKLIAGRHLSDGQGTYFGLASIEARKIIDWYQRNPQKWASNLMASDAEAIVDRISGEFMLPSSQEKPVTAGKGSIYRLVKIEAHRFAGIHAYDHHGAAPPSFVFEPEFAVTLFEGWNGSGKTSLVNAVVWCLTGQMLRPQRLPTDGSDEFHCQVDREQEASNHQISSVTPLPSSRVIPTATMKFVPADTWVELTFIDPNGATISIRRAQSRKSNGKLEEKVTGLDDLPVDAVALHVSTTMPAMLPFLQVGSTSELGLAVAKLTGLSAFVDLAKHANKAKLRISGELTKALNTEIGKIEERYAETKADLEKRIEEFASMAPETPIPELTDIDAKSTLESIKKHFASMKSKGMDHAKLVLGGEFDPENRRHLDDLEGSLGPAIEQLKQIKQLPSIARLAALKLSEGEIQAAREMLDSIHAEAPILAHLVSNPATARRVQLYARVADWLKEHGERHDDNCAVCYGSLVGVVDRATGDLVAAHIQNVAEQAELLSKPIKEWATSWTQKLLQGVSAALRNEIERDLPSAPIDLLRVGIVSDLFRTPGFTGVLKALKPYAEAAAERLLSGLPNFDEPSIQPLPPTIAAHSAPLVEMIQRLERALAFALWCNEHQGSVRGSLIAFRQTEEDSEAGARLEDFGRSLSNLTDLVKGVAPISAAIELSDRLATSLADRETKENRRQACAQASNALAEIIPLGGLAQAQVDGLRGKLQGRTTYWRNKIYRSATTFAPALRETAMDAKGVIDISVVRDGVSAPAQHVANASALRASLMGFFLAFREHVLEARGGLALLMLDDPQDLLDQDNRKHLAWTVVRLASASAQILVATHDSSFARVMVQEGRKERLIQHRSVHPVNIDRSCIDIPLAIDEIDIKRQAFVDAVDSSAHAQDYVSEMRVFLEARIGDLFDDPTYPAFSSPTNAPTLMPLVDRLRGLTNLKDHELFGSHVIKKLCDDPALAEGAEARRILNMAHHKEKTRISYQEVVAIDGDLKRLRGAVELVHEEFRRYRWREPLIAETEVPDNVSPLKPVKVLPFLIPLYPDIAAFAGRLSEAESQDQECEQLSSNWFEDKAFFYIRDETLGFAVPSGAVAIVNNEPVLGRDHNLVIARYKKQIFARRLLKPSNGDGVSLAAEMPDPRRSRPTLQFDQQSVRLYRIAGFIFTQQPPPEGRGEAAEVSAVPELEKVCVGYRVREESAIPLALPGQVILGGAEISASDFDSMVGQIVAISLDSGVSILKRVGNRLPGALGYVRQFETIGGLGDSVVIATELVEGGAELPVMLSARPVIGVLYEEMRAEE